MRKTIALAGVVLAVLSAHPAYAQRRAVSETDALVYIHSAFITQADPGVMATSVVLGPELQRALALPSNAEGAKVYAALIGLSGQKQVDVRKATAQELAQYGTRRGFDRTGGALYTLEAGDLRFLVQYDLQRVNISFVGQLGVPDPDPRPVAMAGDPQSSRKAQSSAPTFTAVAMRDSRINLQWTAQFHFNSAELTEEARAILDREIVPKILKAGQIRYVHVSGHADRVGNARYNQELSEKRAAALRAYLVAKGVDKSKIEVFSYGQTAPAKSCPEETGRALIDCLAPNRRVVLEIPAQ